jgi:hypothetical protein
MSSSAGSHVRWSGWKPGPDATTPGEVFVSVTRFHARRMIDLPRIAWDAYSLRRRWHELSGAVGVWLWLDWRGRKCGSVSVWRSERDMRAFVRWAPHVRIVKRYRNLGQSSTTSWTLPDFDRDAVRTRMKQVISDWMATA